MKLTMLFEEGLGFLEPDPTLDVLNQPVTVCLGKHFHVLHDWDQLIPLGCLIFVEKLRD